MFGREIGALIRVVRMWMLSDLRIYNRRGILAVDLWHQHSGPVRLSHSEIKEF